MTHLLSYYGICFFPYNAQWNHKWISFIIPYDTQQWNHEWISFIIPHDAQWNHERYPFMISHDAQCNTINFILYTIYRYK